MNNIPYIEPNIYDKKLLFLYACNFRYTPFVLPFMFFAAKFNNNAAFEINITDGLLEDTFNDGLKYLKSLFPLTIFNINTTIQTIQPQHYRFLCTPQYIAQYTYIGDIDIMICENILPFHIRRMENYIYDNELRGYSNPLRMSGLHFVKTISWYNTTLDIRQQILLQKSKINDNDEYMLATIASKSNVLIRPIIYDKTQFLNSRPDHGQHISLSRKPFKANSSMEVKLTTEYQNNFISTIESNEFKFLLQYCPQFSLILEQYLKYIKY